MTEINNLYIHIPFCISKCPYCDFYSIPLKSFQQEILSLYIKTLCDEIDSKKEYLKDLKTIYIGGGTPSLLSSRDISNLLNFISKSSSYHKDIEITIEVNPKSITYERLKDYLSLGINRISIGVQSFCNNELLILGRIHNAKDAATAIKLARKAGFKNISIDLIYGIPATRSHSKQSGIINWQESLKKAFEFDPEHISIYELTYEEGTMMTENIKNKRLIAPDEESIEDMYYRGIDLLQQHGYIQYEISNFSKKGFECIHNLNYWNRGEYLGIGASAHSFFDKKRSANVKNLNTYIEKIKNNENPIIEEVELNEEDEIKELIFLGLRKTEGIDLSKLYNKNLKNALNEAISDLLSYGLIELEENNLRLTRKGLILINEIILKILLYIEQNLLS
jgi:oxygen-independent coproporphyrinogen-3 oxidase